MNISVREADPQRDYVRMAEIIQTFERQSITADTLHDWDKQARPDTVRRRFLAVDQNDCILASSSVVHDAWMTEGMFSLWIITDPAFRGQGIGAQLYDYALAFALEKGAQKFNSDVLDHDAASLRFAEQRGFSIWRHLFESILDLHQEAFDETRFAGVIEAVEASGIRLFSLAEAGNTEAALHKLWEVNYRTYMDDPGSSGSFPGFEEFQHITSNGKWFRPEGQILAADGEKYVGLSAVGLFPETNSAYNLMTGVMPDYRGRKIALALKLLTIRVAQRWGVDFIRTNNDSQNAPMLAINRKLGYRPEPGIYRLVKSLNA